MTFAIAQILILSVVVCGVSLLAYGMLNSFVRRYQARQKSLALESGNSLEVLFSIYNPIENPRTSQAFLAVAMLLIAFTLGLNFVGSLALTLAGWVLPSFLINHQKQKRSKAIESQFQPAVVLLTGSLKAGMTLPQAIEAVQDLIPLPLADEIRVINRELALGVPLPQAFENFALRNPQRDIRVATDAILTSIKTGANLASAFEKISNTIRARNQLRRKIDSMTVQGKAQGWVAGFAPFAFGGLFYIIDPQYMSPFFNSFIGNFLIATVLLLEVAAFYAIKKITTVEI